MKTYIAILRGINVGGKRKIKMDELKNTLSALHFSNLTTYIQSGNIIFRSIEGPILSIENILEKKLIATFGYTITTLVRTLPEWKQIIDKFPFDKDLEINRLFVTFLKKTPTEIADEAIEKKKLGTEKIIIREKEIYLYVPDGYGKSKLNTTMFEQKLKVLATTRNWKTITTLLKMAESL